jgi:hypothetical protein
VKVWFRVPIQVEPEEDDPERSRGRIPRDFWVPVKLPHPPFIGLELCDVPGVPFISMPAVTRVFFRCKDKRYSCHVKPFTFHRLMDYNQCVEKMEKTFGNGLPPEK